MALTDQKNVQGLPSQASKFSELRQRIFFLLGALVVYRTGTFIPVPGIDPIALNQFFQATNGNFNWWGKLKFLWRKLFSQPSFVWGLAFGVTPKFQGLGMESYVLNSAADYLRTKRPNYKDVIVTWIGDFNPKMMHVTKSMGANNYHDLKTYRKLFDENAVYERSPIIE